MVKDRCDSEELKKDYNAVVAGSAISTRKGEQTTPVANRITKSRISTAASYLAHDVQSMTTGGQLFESSSRSPPGPQKEAAAAASSSIRLMVKGQIKPNGAAVSRGFNNSGGNA